MQSPATPPDMGPNSGREQCGVDRQQKGHIMRNRDFAVHYYVPDDPQPHLLNPAGFHVAGDEKFTAEDVLTEVALRRHGYRSLRYPFRTRWVPVFRVQDTETWLELTPRLHPDGLDMGVFERALAYGLDYARTALEEEPTSDDVEQDDSLGDADPSGPTREPATTEEFTRRAAAADVPPF